MDQQPKPKIGPFTATMMLIVAGFFDFLQFVISLLGFLPTVLTQVIAFFVTTPLSIFSYLVFTIWFFFLDVQFFNIKKPGQFFARMGGFIVENLPYLTAAPILTTSVLFTIVEANGINAFPANALPKFLLNATPVGRVAKKALNVKKKLPIRKPANDNTPQKEELKEVA
ncbi:MAG: hypothetical protein ACJKSS_00715 [Patescibacteria group bacterium UBA2103]